MKEVLIITGVASFGYGMYLLHAKKMSAIGSRSSRTAAGASASTPAVAVTTGPTITSSAGPVDNSASPVERYAAGYAAKFPPMTYVMIPGAGSLDNVDTTNMHAVVQF